MKPFPAVATLTNKAYSLMLITIQSMNECALVAQVEERLFHMKFNYRKIPTAATPKKHWIKRPLLQATLFNGNKRTSVLCLVDSGADDCLFHASLAKLLDIDLKSGPEKEFSGIAKGYPIKGYRHTVELQVYGM